ncbi:HNH endonuclease family protein [Streptomyces microflavus]|uniref:HNH endonuclease family protein n=1 Tax=Streptomyces microflavus TaxID=1919 RepID=UPI0029ABFAC8|nr:HNH endonuclease family protein [Streptomyces microflavus]MDX2407342.1 HNH endonuclease family protein [Streptomyces microflavus]
MTHRPLLPLAAALLALSLAACNPQTPDDDAKQPDPAPTTSTAPSGAAGGPPEGALNLTDAIAKIPTGDEKRDGYERDTFKHWTDEDQDGCPTRAEVLIEEATTEPEQGERCTLTGGAWTSAYDGVEVTDAKRLDIDHMVPLAEAWDSGAHAWSDERRQAYANDLTAPRSLIAVTAKTNRSKGDKDPADWLPPATNAHCTYAADWTATKLRWQLNADNAERTALLNLADQCPDTVVEYEPAP